MPIDITQWHGVGTSPADCIFNYGLVVKYLPAEGKWKCINFGGEHYHLSRISEQELHQPFINGWAKPELPEFLNRCAATWDEWVKLPVFHKIHDFIAFFGAYELFGTDYSGGLSAQNVCLILDMPFQDEYGTTAPEIPFASQPLSVREIEKQLSRLRRQIKLKIISLLDTQPGKRIQLDPEKIVDSTYMYYSGNDDDTYEGYVTSIWLEGGKINISVQNHDYPREISEDDYTYALNSHAWLLAILSNMCEVLQIDAGKI